MSSRKYAVYLVRWLLRTGRLHNFGGTRKRCSMTFSGSMAQRKPSDVLRRAGREDPQDGLLTLGCSSLKEAVIEIVDNDVTEELYEWVLTRDIQEVGSCCTIIAERFAAEAPEHLVGRGLSRLLLGPILLETANLDAKSARCTSRDECMAALLTNGAGRYGRQGFFRFLRKMKFDISFMSTVDMMRKDFQKWTVGPGATNVHGCEGRVMTVAMSTVGVPLWDVMDREDILEDLKRFQKKFKLDLHLLVTGYYDIHDRYRREILLLPKDRELTQHVDTCFRAHEDALKLSVIHVEGLPEETLVFRQGQVTASRRVLRQILEDHFAI